MRRKTTSFENIFISIEITIQVKLHFKKKKMKQKRRCPLREPFPLRMHISLYASTVSKSWDQITPSVTQDIANDHSTEIHQDKSILNRKQRIRTEVVPSLLIT